MLVVAGTPFHHQFAFKSQSCSVKFSSEVRVCESGESGDLQAPDGNTGWKVTAQQVRRGSSGGILSQFGCAPSPPLGVPSPWLTCFWTHLTPGHLLLRCCQYDSQRLGLVGDDTPAGDQAAVRLCRRQPGQGAAAPAQSLQTSSAAQQEPGQPSATTTTTTTPLPDTAVQQEGWQTSSSLLRAPSDQCERE